MEILVDTDELFESFRNDVRTHQILNEGLIGIIGSIIKAFVMFIKKIFELIFGIIRKIFELITGGSGGVGGSISSKNGFRHKRDYPNPKKSFLIEFYDYNKFINSLEQSYYSTASFTEACIDMTTGIYDRCVVLCSKYPKYIKDGTIDKEDVQELFTEDIMNTSSKFMKDTKFTQFFKTFNDAKDVKDINSIEEFKNLSDIISSYVKQELLEKDYTKIEELPDPLDLQNQIKNLSKNMKDDMDDISKKVNNVIKKMENVNNLRMDFNDDELQTKFYEILKYQSTCMSDFLRSIFSNIYLYTINLDRGYIKRIIEFNKTCHDILSGNTEYDEFDYRIYTDINGDVND